MKKQTDIIIGAGEIGKSLFAVLSEAHNVIIRDIENVVVDGNVRIMHICFPYSKKFVKEVKKYQMLYKPKYTVIHSTVAAGTSKKCDAFYSPVRGIHPHLEKSLVTFVKYLAPRSNYIKSYFSKVGIKVEETENTETLEVMKLYCTTIYALNVIAEKEVWKHCKDNGLDYNIVYTECNKTYNEGYKLLGFPQYTKYILNHREGKIGGHCLIPNCKLLNTDIAKFVLKQNDRL